MSNRVKRENFKENEGTFWSIDPDGNQMRRVRKEEDDSDCCMVCKHFKTCKTFLRGIFVPTFDTFARTCNHFSPWAQTIAVGPID